LSRRDGIGRHARLSARLVALRRRSCTRGRRGSGTRAGDLDRQRGARLRRTGRRGALRQCLRRLPSARRAAAYPALAENKNLASADYIESLLFNGSRGMPPLGRMMSDAQVADVINYLRTHFGNRYENQVSAAEVGAARPQSERGH
jgi:hypothetical protein